MYGLHSKKHVLLENVGGKVFLRQITKNRLFSFHKKHKNTKNVFMRYCIFLSPCTMQYNFYTFCFVSNIFNTSFYDYTPIPQNSLIDSNIWCRKEWITLRINYVRHQITFFFAKFVLAFIFLIPYFMYSGYDINSHFIHSSIPQKWSRLCNSCSFDTL